MNKFPFSIVIPVYNSEKYLKECIDSLDKQTYKDFEIILIDDGSTDSSGEMCDKMQYDYPQMNFKISHQPNSGQIAARNNGIKLAEGQYCLFLDSDDTFIPDALKKIEETINKWHPDMVIFNALRDTGDNKYPFWPMYFETTTFLDENETKKLKSDVIATNKFNNICLKAIKTDIASCALNYDEYSNIKKSEDYLMQLPIFDKCNTFVYLPEYLYIYRYNMNSVSLSGFYERAYKDAKIICQKEIEFAKKWQVEDYEQVVNNNFMSYTASAIKQFYHKNVPLSYKEKIAYIREIANDTYFRHGYKIFHGKINSNVGRLVLWLTYHRLYKLALFVATHDPKVHGAEKNIIGGK